MTAEFQFNPPGEGSGGSHSPSHSSKKFKINKMILYIGGALVIILFLVFKGKQNNTNAQDTTQPIDPTTVGYPNNSVDYQAAMQNSSDLLQSNMDQTLNQFQAQMQADYGTQLQAISNKMDTVQGQMEELTAHPNPSNTISPVPAATPPPAPSMPATTVSSKTVAKQAPKTAANPKDTSKPKTVTVTVKKGDTLSELTKKYLGSGSKSTYDEVAKANHISDPNKIKVGQKITMPVIKK